MQGTASSRQRTLSHTHTQKKKKNTLSTRRHIFAELEFGFSKKTGPGKGARFPHHTNTRMTHRDIEQNRLRLSGPGIRGPVDLGRSLRLFPNLWVHYRPQSRRQHTTFLQAEESLLHHTPESRLLARSPCLDWSWLEFPEAT